MLATRPPIAIATVLGTWSAIVCVTVPTPSTFALPKDPFAGAASYNVSTKS